MAYITVDTKLVVLLGTPLRQSVSYLAQNRVYERLGLDYYYIPVEVKSSDQLRTVVAVLKQMNLAATTFFPSHVWTESDCYLILQQY